MKIAKFNRIRVVILMFRQGTDLHVTLGKGVLTKKPKKFLQFSISSQKVHPVSALCNSLAAVSHVVLPMQNVDAGRSFTKLGYVWLTEAPPNGAQSL